MLYAYICSKYKKKEIMDGLITYFEIITALLIILFVIVVVGSFIKGYYISDAEMKEYYRREEEKKAEKRLKRLNKKPYEGSMDKYMW